MITGYDCPIIAFYLVFILLMMPMAHSSRLRFAPLLCRGIIVTLLGMLFCCGARAGQMTDSLAFGNADSEQSHSLKSATSDTITHGGLDESARRLLPLDPPTWEGGSVSFTMKVDPNQQNYFTSRFWGSEANENRLILFCQGKQIGWRHLGEVDILEFGQDDASPPYNGRFYYTTSPLPLEMTRGKSELHFEIRCTGQTWAYGTTFAQYQKTMIHPTRGIYRVYTHTDGFFSPPIDEKQGSPPSDPPVRSTPGAEVLEHLKQRINDQIARFLGSEKPLNQMQMQFLTRAYHVKWSAAYESPKVIEQAIKELDNSFETYRRNPRFAASDPATPNADWFGLGPSGDIVRYLKDELAGALDQQIDDGNGGGKTTPPNDLFGDAPGEPRLASPASAALYTSQSMITDLYVYAANRGVEAIDPPHATASGGPTSSDISTNRSVFSHGATATPAATAPPKRAAEIGASARIISSSHPKA